MRECPLNLVMFVAALFLIAPCQCWGFRHLKEGEPPPGFTLNDLEDRSHSVADYRGRVLLIIYWRLGQDRSLDALKALKVIGEQFKNQPLSILSVTKDANNISSLKETKKSLDLSFPILLDSKEEVYSQFGVFVFPSTALIDKKGIYRYHYGGFRDDFRDVISKQVNVQLGFTPGEAMQVKGDEQSLLLTDEQKKAQNHLNLGKTLKKRGMDEKSLEEFTKAVELDDANPDAQVYLGFALLDIKEVDQALGHFNRAMELDPKSTDAKIGLGRAYRMKGETDKALQVLQAELGLYPDAAIIHLELGEVYESMGKHEGALKHYKAAAESALKEQKKF